MRESGTNFTITVASGTMKEKWYASLDQMLCGKRIHACTTYVTFSDNGQTRIVTAQNQQMLARKLMLWHS